MTRRYAALAFAFLAGFGACANARATQACARPNLASDDARRCIATANATSYTQAGNGSPFAACVTALSDAPPCPIDAKPRGDDLSQALVYLGAAFEISHSDDMHRFGAYRRAGLQLAFRALTNAEESRGGGSDEDALAALRFLVARMESSG